MLAIAHRGASGTKPENTLEAFTHALALGADGIELDVRRCGSGEAVVIHDGLLQRTVESNGRVSQKSLAQLRSLSVKGGGHIPSLEDVFHAIGTEAYCFIELKTPDLAADVAQLVKHYVKKGWQPERLIVIGFDHKALLAAKAAWPALTIGASFTRLTRAGVQKAQRMGARHIVARYDTVTAEHVTLAHALGLSLIVWTVNTPTAIARMRALGVDGIMGDYPELIRNASTSARF